MKKSSRLATILACVALTVSSSTALAQKIGVIAVSHAELWSGNKSYRSEIQTGGKVKFSKLPAGTYELRLVGSKEYFNQKKASKDNWVQVEELAIINTGRSNIKRTTVTRVGAKFVFSNISVSKSTTPYVVLMSGITAEDTWDATAIILSYGINEQGVK
jgi:hypothetical protein